MSVSSPATLVQISVSSGGMPKQSVLLAQVGRDGVEGDRQRNKKYHGGERRAVCLFSVELYAQLAAEGIGLSPGDVGENFTTRGLDLLTLAPGDRLRVGQCLIELTEVRVPCRQLDKLHPDLMKKLQGRSGWLARVIEGGVVRPGDSISTPGAGVP